MRSCLYWISPCCSYKYEIMLEKDIISLGLSDKEAKVYLASLELGPSTVQLISQKSKVNRATAYVVIDSLMEMGLMSTYDENRKTFFTAEDPERLLEFLRNEEGEVKKKIDLLQERLPELKSILNTKSGKPTVKYYEGYEGLEAVRMDFINSLNSGDIIYAFVPIDDYIESGLKEKGVDITKKRVDKKIKMKVIYTSRNGRQLDYEKKEGIDLKEYLYIDYEKYPFSGGMNIYGDKILMMDYKGKMGGVVIENATLADSLKSFSRLIWDKKDLFV